MKFKEYIESHQAFTADDLRTVATWGTAQTQLQRACRNGTKRTRHLTGMATAYGMAST